MSNPNPTEWTKAQEDRLVVMWDEGTPLEIIAQALGRSKSGIRAKRQNLGLPGRGKRDTRWTVDRDKRLREFVLAGFTDAKAAAVLGVKESTVQKRRVKLNIAAAFIGENKHRRAITLPKLACLKDWPGPSFNRCDAGADA